MNFTTFRWHCCLFSFLLSALALAPMAAELASFEAGRETNTIRIVAGGDGPFQLEELYGRTAVRNEKSYLYFDVNNHVDVPRTIYVGVTFHNRTDGGWLIEYDSSDKEVLKVPSAPGAFKNSATVQPTQKEWTVAWIRLPQSRFQNRCNGADFRITNHSPMAISHVVLADVPPEGVTYFYEPELHVDKPHRGGEGLTVTFGASNFGPNTPRAQIENFYKSAQIDMWEKLGVTSWESYVRWSGFEPELGRWDFSMYDAECDILERHGMKWVPFLLIGMNYATPDWYQKSEKNVNYYCLEHDEQSGVQSIWNPDLTGQVERVIQAFGEHYRERGVIESVLLGITGDFGEAIYPVTGGGWTGNYHQHPGFWCGDPYARADFRAFLKKRYGDTKGLARAWGGLYRSFDDVDPFLLKDAPSERAWLDFVDWYRGSMNNWIDLWMRETRKAFPDTPIQLCTGGHAPPTHGSHFGEQARLAAKYDGGIRITNEASHYPANFWQTRWIASAGSFYGAPYSFEPAGPVDINGITRRVYGVTASGARGLFEYYPNVFSGKGRTNQFYNRIPFFQPHERLVDVAVLIPDTWLTIGGDEIYPRFFGQLQPLRDRLDFDFVDERMLERGAAKRYRVLLVLSADIFEAATFKSLQDYTEDGGVVIAACGDRGYRTPGGGEEKELPELFATPTAGGQPVANAVGRGGTIRLPFAYEPEKEDILDTLVRVTCQPESVLPGVPSGPSLDGFTDEVYVTLTRDALLYLNTSNVAFTTVPTWDEKDMAFFRFSPQLPGRIDVPAQSILEVPLR